MIKIDHQRVRELGRAGWRNADIAIEVCCSERHVRRIRDGRTFGLDSARQFSPDEILHVEIMLADGCSYTEIGRTVGRSANVIARRWPDRGWTSIQAGEFRRLTQRLETIIDERWARHLTRVS